MPLYEYRCQECDAISQFFIRRPSDEENAWCQECGSSAVEKMFSTPAVPVINAANASAPSCGKEARCCGRETPCDTPPCER